MITLVLDSSWTSSLRSYPSNMFLQCIIQSIVSELLPDDQRVSYEDPLRRRIQVSRTRTTILLNSPRFQFSRNLDKVFVMQANRSIFDSQTYSPSSGLQNFLTFNSKCSHNTFRKSRQYHGYILVHLNNTFFEREVHL